MRILQLRRNFLCLFRPPRFQLRHALLRQSVRRKPQLCLKCCACPFNRQPRQSIVQLVHGCAKSTRLHYKRNAAGPHLAGAAISIFFTKVRFSRVSFASLIAHTVLLTSLLCKSKMRERIPQTHLIARRYKWPRHPFPKLLIAAAHSSSLPVAPKTSSLPQIFPMTSG